MPAHAGKPAISDDDIKAAVEYMDSCVRAFAALWRNIALQAAVRACSGERFCASDAPGPTLPTIARIVKCLTTHCSSVSVAADGQLVKGNDHDA